MEPSHRTSPPLRLQQRSNTWPVLPSTTSTAKQPMPVKTTFEEQLDQQPGAHFLSPTMYDDWSDSDDDDDDIEWAAGITDFALFDSDRRRAKATGEELPQKWDSMLQSQASALDRSVDRIRAEHTEDVPGLTPDASPRLSDDLEGPSSRPVIPSYLRSKSDPDVRSESAVMDDDLTIAFFPPPGHQRQTQPLPQRPGLRGTRTLSGKPHAWRRPSLDTLSVQEDSQGERNAELEQQNEVQ